MWISLYVYHICLYCLFIWKGVLLIFKNGISQTTDLVKIPMKFLLFFYLTNIQFYKHMIQLSINKCYNLLHMEKLNIYFIKLMIGDLHTWIVSLKYIVFVTSNMIEKFWQWVLTFTYKLYHNKRKVQLIINAKYCEKDILSFCLKEKHKKRN